MSRVVIFVHGLGGKSDTTWGSFPSLLASDPSLSVVVDSFEYPTLLLRLPFLKKTPRIQTLAAGLRTHILARFPQEHSIALVCHSLGGLVAKQYLVEQLRGQPHSTPVTHLLLFAVPNTGSQLAKIARFISWRNYPLRQLCQNSDFLDTLNRDWQRLDVNSRLLVRYVYGAQDSIVTEASSTHLANPDTTETILDEGHISIAKPTTQDDLAYRILKHALLTPSPAHPRDSGPNPERPRERQTKDKNIVRSASEEAYLTKSAQVQASSLLAVWSTGKSETEIPFVVVGPATRRAAPPPSLSADYAYLTSFGDMDSLLEVLVFLARYFPKTRALKYPASRVDAELKKSPLAVIGGPLGEEGRGGNSITEFLNGRSAHPITYDLDSESPELRVSNRSYPTLYDETSRAIIQDAGLIFRCVNPWNPSTRVLCFQGTHTLGVLGSVLALTHPAVADLNAEKIVTVLGSDPSFIAPLSVQVDQGNVFPPELDQNELLPWK